MKKQSRTKKQSKPGRIQMQQTWINNQAKQGVKKMMKAKKTMA